MFSAWRTRNWDMYALSERDNLQSIEYMADRRVSPEGIKILQGDLFFSRFLLFNQLQKQAFGGQLKSTK